MFSWGEQRVVGMTGSYIVSWEGVRYMSNGSERGEYLPET